MFDIGDKYVKLPYISWFGNDLVGSTPNMP